MSEAAAALPGLAPRLAARLDTLVAAVRRWQRAINLIGPATLPAIWTRHVADSLQLVPLAPLSPTEPAHWADLGSGGGFPGLVIAAALAESAPRARVTLVESDARKAAFLRQTAAAMDLRVTVAHARAERLAPLAADVVSARALAPLDALLPLVARHLAPGGVALLPKGRGHATEVAAVAPAAFEITVRPSATDPDAAILVLRQRNGT